MTQQLNVYDNIYTPTVQNYTTIKEWFNLIKKSEFTQIILQARNFGKGSKIYDSLKATVPAITYNFTFQTKKSNSNISGATGLLYIDIDDLTFNIDLLDKSKIFAYYKSFGGKGYSILVQVNGLSISNYDSTYSAILNELGLINYYDSGAKKITQFNVLSFDPNIFINYDSFVFDSIVDNDSFPSFDFSPLSMVIEEREEAYTIDGVELLSEGNRTIRFNNLNEMYIDGDYTVDWNGFALIKCWVPFKKIKANRNAHLLGYTNNLVWLNPLLNAAGAENILIKINIKMCEEPVDKAQIKRIVKSVFKQKQDGTLKPIYNWKPRKIVFAPFSELTREQKLAKCRELMNAKKTDESKTKLYNIIEEWDFERFGKIGQTVIHKNFPISKKTVEKYWGEFKNYVAELNENNKMIKTNKMEKEVKEVATMAGGHERLNLSPEPKPEVKPEPLKINTDMKSMDDYVMFNYTRFQRATQLVDHLERFQIERKLKTLIAEGYQGEETFVTDVWILNFEIDSNQKKVTLTGVLDTEIAA